MMKEKKMSLLAQQDLYERYADLQTALPDLYTALNVFRDWFNRQYPDFEVYLEDAWNTSEWAQHPGQTWFEYILRSKITKDETAALAYDVYLNRQDERGVWHLEDYQESILREPDPGVLLRFMQANGLKQ
jgi:hypothetical protein